MMMTLKQKENALQPKDRLVLPLDFDSVKEALRIVKELKDYIGLFKIGWTLFMNAGPEVIGKITQAIGRGSQIFFDVKVLDIPRTMQGATAAVISSHAIKYVTAHTFEGKRHVAAVVEAARQGGNVTKVIGVTVLTSQNDEDVQSLWQGKTALERVLMLAQIAKDGGAVGVVCSGHEARAVKEKFGEDFVVITPAIRPEWSHIAQDDQRRVMTPREAIQAGADYIVVGRPIYQAKDPVEAAKRVIEEIRQAR
jgi:orotidine-5'-phosphate decarboxylase